MYTSSWKHPYELYRKLHTVWPVETYKTGLNYLLHTPNYEERARKWEQYKQTYREIQGIDLDEKIRPEWLGWADEVRHAFDNVHDAKEPFEDAYQAAFYMLGIPSEYFEDESRQHLYRGQRCHHWSVVPSIFRDIKEDDKSKALLTRRKNRIVSFVEYLKKHYPKQYPEAALYAIAQHYVGWTWLVDLTWSAWVALFFASWSGEYSFPDMEPLDIGMVLMFWASEWKRMSAEGTNPLGSIFYIEVEGVPRINAQKGLFLVGSHYDLVKQYTPFTVRFWQRRGLTFEDPTLGVTHDLLMPKNDELLELSLRWEREWKANPESFPVSLKSLMGGLAYRAPREEEYKSIITSQLKSLKENLGYSTDIDAPEMTQLIDKLARFHTKLYGMQGGGRAVATMHDLTSAAGQIFSGLIDGKLPSLDDLIRDSYGNGARPEDWKIIEEARAAYESESE